MKCYKCAKEGKDTDAIGICVVCGMGLCIDHVRVTEVSFWEVNYMDNIEVSAIGLENRVERKAPRFLCDDCYASLAGNREGIGGDATVQGG